MRKNLGNLLLQYWIPLACGLTVLCGLVYVAVQQDMRQGANDPQIQMAEDAAAALAGGASPESIVPSGPQIDMAKSLAPYIIVFDITGKAIASNAVLNGATPVPPPGVFTFTQQYGEDRLTWQPQTDVRSAAVIKRYGSPIAGFVLAGRSLREVERRESMLNWQVTLAWIAAMLGTLVLTAGIALVIKR